MKLRHLLIALAAVLSGCAAYAPPPYGSVVTMTLEEAEAASGYPPPGTTWRLHEGQLKVLSPNPVAPAPPPPQRPPPPPTGWGYPPPPPGWYGPAY